MILIGIVTPANVTAPAQVIEDLEAEISQRGYTGFGANFLHLTAHRRPTVRLEIIQSTVLRMIHSSKPTAHALIVSNIKTEAEAAALRKYGATLWHTTPVTDVAFIPAQDLWVNAPAADSYEPVEALIESRLIQNQRFKAQRKAETHE